MVKGGEEEEKKKKDPGLNERDYGEVWSRISGQPAHAFLTCRSLLWVEAWM